MGCRPLDELEFATGLVPLCGGLMEPEFDPELPGVAAGGRVGTTGAGDIRLSICCMLVGTLG